MANLQNEPTYNIKRAINKLLLSGFVVISFGAYALHKPSTPLIANSGGITPTQDPQAQQATSPTQTDPAATTTPDGQSLTNTSLQPAAQAASADQIPTLTSPPPTPAPTETATGLFKDGSYTGSTENAFYGMVQVKTVIQNHKIAVVQLLQFPNDRRTSQRINAIAIPFLQQEAIQAQSANVDIISGATLTSQAFAQSLQTTLDKARN